jgi:tetratricopeptide (TPR) repeat protein
MRKRILVAIALLVASSTLAFSLPPQGEPEAIPSADDPPAYTGSSSCRECHEHFYELWAPSHHGRAMQVYTPELAAERLTPQESFVTVGEMQYRAEISPEAGWVIERGPDGETTYPIEHVLGGKNVFYFLTSLERGRLQTLPVAYDVRAGEWFDTSASGMRHFPDIGEEAVHWRERPYTFNTSCHGCHVSQLVTNYNADQDSYHTTWAEPGINCETCHGPAEEHVRSFRAAAGGEDPEELGLISISGFTEAQTNDLCAPCHAKMNAVTTGFPPGERYFDHFDLATLEDPDFYPDGRDLGENYTFTGWRMNPCAATGALDCAHCHTSSGRFRQKDDPNAACLPCHQARVEDVVAHSRHAADIEGSECIDCHMPMTEFARMLRSDHSFLPPTPATTIAHESPNACNLCHADQDAAWADALVREWHGDEHQDAILYRAGLVDAARKEEWRRLPEMLAYIGSEERDEVFAASLLRLFGRCPDPRVGPVLAEAMLADPSPLVRASAAMTAGTHLTRELLPALLAATGDDYRLVRVRAASSLAPLPPDALAGEERERLERAVAEYLTSVTARPDDSISHYNLGNFRVSRGELESAVESFERAAELDPFGVAPLVNASLAYSLLERNVKAEATLRRALERSPGNAAANFNLGLLLGELERLDEAEAAFRGALETDPSMAAAAYNLGVLLTRDRMTEGITWCRRAWALSPGDPKYAYTLAYFLRGNGELDEAITTLRQMVSTQMPHPGAYLLLGEILEGEGRRDEAIEVYREGRSNERLSDRDRYELDGRVRALESR